MYSKMFLSVNEDKSSSRQVGSSFVTYAVPIVALINVILPEAFFCKPSSVVSAYDNSYNAR